MDGDFQAHYLSAEQAYGAGDFHTAQSIVVDLLSQLDDLAENNTEQETVLAWRAFVALLAGNIQLYGLNEPNQASGFYELVLKSNPQDTLKGLAEQGLERIQERQGDVPEVVDPLPASPPPASTLIQDPFLTQPSTAKFTVVQIIKRTQAKPLPRPGWTPVHQPKPRSPPPRLPSTKRWPKW